MTLTLAGFSGKASVGTPSPTPARPAAPLPVGTQDSPVLPGQKPQAVPVALPAQPSKKRALPWWEADWAATKRATGVQRMKREVLAEDLGRRAPSPVAGMTFSDVIDTDTSSVGLQGRRLIVKLSTREGEPVTRRLITDGSEHFPAVRLPGFARVVEPTVDRTAVAPGFADLGRPEVYYAVQPFVK